MYGEDQMVSSTGLEEKEQMRTLSTGLCPLPLLPWALSGEDLPRTSCAPYHVPLGLGLPGVHILLGRWVSPWGWR